MANFKDRVFGADLHPTVKDKLKARQLMSENEVSPNQSLQFSTNPEDGQPFDLKEALGDRTFNQNLEAQGGGIDLLTLGVDNLNQLKENLAILKKREVFNNF